MNLRQTVRRMMGRPTEKIHDESKALEAENRLLMLQQQVEAEAPAMQEEISIMGNNSKGGRDGKEKA